MSESTSTTVPLPPARIRFMPEDKDDATFVRGGVQLAEVLRSHGMSDDDQVLDLGSGYGRLAIGLLSSGFRGGYVVLDIQKRPITWCRRHLTPFTDRRFRFVHLDVRSGRYNPRGAIAPTDLRFPVRKGSQDCVAVFSVFTHMYEADIRRYLREIRRVLTTDGVAVTTWFVYDEARLPAATSEETTVFPMVNEINAVTRYSEPSDPLRAIAYDEAHVHRMVARAGLRLTRTAYGSWCGEPSTTGQDVLVLAKARPQRPSALRRLRRRVRRVRRVRRSG